jgi:hypothetical protein
MDVCTLKCIVYGGGSAAALLLQLDGRISGLGARRRRAKNFTRVK